MSWCLRVAFVLLLSMHCVHGQLEYSQTDCPARFRKFREEDHCCFGNCVPGNEWNTSTSVCTLDKEADKGPYCAKIIAHEEMCPDGWEPFVDGTPFCCYDSSHSCTTGSTVYMACSLRESDPRGLISCATLNQLDNKHFLKTVTLKGTFSSEIQLNFDKGAHWPAKEGFAISFSIQLQKGLLPKGKTGKIPLVTKLIPQGAKIGKKIPSGNIMLEAQKTGKKNLFAMFSMPSGPTPKNRAQTRVECLNTKVAINDGRWHDIVMLHTKNNVTLMVDGLADCKGNKVAACQLKEKYFADADRSFNKVNILPGVRKLPGQIKHARLTYSHEGHWSAWSPCDKECGGGWKHRHCTATDTGQCLGRRNAACNVFSCPKQPKKKKGAKKKVIKRYFKQRVHLPRPILDWDFRKSLVDNETQVKLTLSGGAVQIPGDGLVLKSGFGLAPSPVSFRDRTIVFNAQTWNNPDQGAPVFSLMGFNNITLPFDAIVFNQDDIDAFSISHENDTAAWAATPIFKSSAEQEKTGFVSFGSGIHEEKSSNLTMAFSYHFIQAKSMVSFIETDKGGFNQWLEIKGYRNGQRYGSTIRLAVRENSRVFSPRDSAILIGKRTVKSDTGECNLKIQWLRVYEETLSAEQIIFLTKDKGTYNALTRKQQLKRQKQRVAKEKKAKAKAASFKNEQLAKKKKARKVAEEKKAKAVLSYKQRAERYKKNLLANERLRKAAWRKKRQEEQVKFDKRRKKQEKNGKKKAAAELAKQKKAADAALAKLKRMEMYRKKKLKEMLKRENAKKTAIQKRLEEKEGKAARRKLERIGKKRRRKQQRMARILKMKSRRERHHKRRRAKIAKKRGRRAQRKEHKQKVLVAQRQLTRQRAFNQRVKKERTQKKHWLKRERGQKTKAHLVGLTERKHKASVAQLKAKKKAQLAEMKRMAKLKEDLTKHKIREKRAKSGRRKALESGLERERKKLQQQAKKKAKLFEKKVKGFKQSMKTKITNERTRKKREKAERNSKIDVARARKIERGIKERRKKSREKKRKKERKKKRAKAAEKSDKKKKQHLIYLRKKSELSQKTRQEVAAKFKEKQFKQARVKREKKTKAALIKEKRKKKELASKRRMERQHKRAAKRDKTRKRREKERDQKAKKRLTPFLYNLYMQQKEMEKRSARKTDVDRRSLNLAEYVKTKVTGFLRGQVSKHNQKKRRLSKRVLWAYNQIIKGNMKADPSKYARRQFRPKKAPAPLPSAKQEKRAKLKKRQRQRSKRVAAERKRKAAENMRKRKASQHRNRERGLKLQKRRQIHRKREQNHKKHVRSERRRKHQARQKRSERIRKSRKRRQRSAFGRRSTFSRRSRRRIVIRRRPKPAKCPYWIPPYPDIRGTASNYAQYSKPTCIRKVSGICRVWSHLCTRFNRGRCVKFDVNKLNYCIHWAGCGRYLTCKRYLYPCKRGMQKGKGKSRRCIGFVTRLSRSTVRKRMLHGRRKFKNWIHSCCRKKKRGRR